MHKTKVLLVGPFPPPYGGNAIQMCAWLRCLERLGSYDCHVLNIGESRRENIQGCISVHGLVDFLKKLWAFAREGYILHLHTNGHNFKSWLVSFACIASAVPYGRKTVVAFGSGDAPQYIRSAKLMRPLIKIVLKLSGWFICMNEQMRTALIEAGALPERISIVHGFLGMHSEANCELPEKLSQYASSHYPLLGATVYVPQSGVLYPEYGIDLLVKVLGELREAYPHIGTVIMGPTEEARKQIECLQYDDGTVMFTGPLPHDLVLTLMKQLTVFVRPTFTDGDSISVREALALKIPVVASDTDYRPPGVIIFKKGDMQDFLLKMLKTLENPSVAVGKGENHGGLETTSADSLLAIYRSISMVCP